MTSRLLCLLILFLTDGAELWGKCNGTTRERAAICEYGPFGENLRASGPEAAANRHRFSGKFTDPATGLLYFGHRWYDPEAGRWLSRDPLGEGGGLNLYGFLGNDPINFIDPFGLSRYTNKWLEWAQYEQDNNKSVGGFFKWFGNAFVGAAVGVGDGLVWPSNLQPRKHRRP